MTGANGLSCEGIVVLLSPPDGFRLMMVQAHGELTVLRLSDEDARRVAGDLMAPPRAVGEGYCTQPVGLVCPKGSDKNPATRPATAEDVRLMIREEIRAALAERRAPSTGSPRFGMTAHGIETRTVG